MTLKEMTITISGCREGFSPFDLYSPSPEQKFDRMWPCDQRKFLERAEALLREGHGG